MSDDDLLPAADTGPADEDDLEIELEPAAADAPGWDAPAAAPDFVLPPPPGVAAPAGALPAVGSVNDAFAGDDVLVIDTDDLSGLPPSAGGYAPIAPDGGYLPPVDSAPGPYAYAKKGGPLAAGLVGSLLTQMVIAGAIGGFLAWVMIEPGSRASELSLAPEDMGPVAVLMRMAGFGAAIGGLIGLALGAVEGVVIGAWARAGTAGGLGLLIGGAGGAMGGVVAQVLYGVLGGGSHQTPMIQQIVARALGWALVGAFVGLGPGVMLMAPRKIVNGLLGGLGGGFIGGLLFDPIGAAMQGLGAETGTVARLAAIVVLGGCTGLGIGLVEEMRKEAWLVITEGPLAGKQFIIYKDVTWIGSAPGMDIPLVKDRAIAPKHCSIEAAGGAHVIRDAGTGQTFVNGRPVAQQRLHDGDMIGIGATGLQYNTRPFAAGPGM